MKPPELVSNALCPYAQRVAVVAVEKGIDLIRTPIDLANKPDWFRALSPTGKIPLLRVGDDALFESLPIIEYLDEVSPGWLHPRNAMTRAKHRGWIEFASATLADISSLYNAVGQEQFDLKWEALRGRFRQVEAVVRAEPWFGGATFHMVDAVWASVLRYFEVLEALAPAGFFNEFPRVRAWRAAAMDRESVRRAVSPDYAALLRAFLVSRPSYLASQLLALGGADDMPPA